ncbi:MAG: recombinase family protein [Xenococcus sp. MO_188.B8]|nr:recombinase family protein [Xenococcus sp. MO_188.B8]
MKIGYIFNIGEKRINTVPEQIEALKQAECQVIFSDIHHDFPNQQPLLESMFEYAREGDILVIWQIYCLAPTVRRFVKIARRLYQQNIGLQVLTGEASLFQPHTLDSEKMLATFAAFAKLEQEYASSRTKKGLEELKSQGKVLGRRSNFEQWKPKLIEMQKLGYSAYRISQETRLCYETAKKYLRQLEQES